MLCLNTPVAEAGTVHRAMETRESMSQQAAARVGMGLHAAGQEAQKQAKPCSKAGQGQGLGPPSHKGLLQEKDS